MLILIYTVFGTFNCAWAIQASNTTPTSISKASDSETPVASLLHNFRGNTHNPFTKHYSYFRIYGKDFDHTLLSPDCPPGPKKKCKGKKRGQGLKLAFLECASGRLEQWEYMDGGSYMKTEDGVKWDFWIEGKAKNFSTECMKTAIKAAGGPEPDQVRS